MMLCVSFFAVTNAFVVPRAITRTQNTGTRMHPSPLPKTPMYMSAEGDTPEKSKLPMLLDPGTKGGALFLSLVLFVIPLLGYQVVTNVFGVDEIEAGKWIGVGFTVFTLVLWVSTYIFRVATKDMTYVRFLNARLSSERES
jgi:hypothetical protein